MKMVAQFRNIALLLLLLLPSIACDVFVAPPQTEPPQQTEELPSTSTAQVEVPATTESPTATKEPTQEPSLEPTQAQITIEVVPTDTSQVVAALPSSVLGAPVDGGGTCGPPPDFPFDCNVALTDDAFVQFLIYQDNRELTGNDGVQQVDFSVFSPDKTRTIYSHTESNSPYCIFGGDSKCNSWVFEDGVYKWSNGGEAVQNGTYVISIDALVASGEPIHWEYLVDINLQ